MITPATPRFFRGPLSVAGWEFSLCLVSTKSTPLCSLEKDARVIRTGAQMAVNISALGWLGPTLRMSPAEH